MKKILLLFASVVVTTSCFAASPIDITIEKITYRINPGSSEATVYKADRSITKATIQKAVTYENSDYSVTEIGASAFNSCSALTSVTIGNSVTKIGKGAFSYCTGLTSVSIGNSVTEIGSYAFDYCTGLTKLWYNAENCDGDGFSSSSGFHWLDGCSNLSEVVIGENVKTIPKYFLYKCTGLTSVTIPNSVTEIGNFAFSGCTGLTSVTIGNSVKSIGNSAFAYCSGLKTVYCYAMTPPAHRSYAFDGSYPEYMTLHVPTGTKNAYAAATGWRKFGYIIDDLPVSGGVEDIFIDTTADSIDVYNLQGRRLNVSSREELSNLPAGIYIVNGKKVYIN